MQDLIVLSHEDYLTLKRELKAAGLDVCYTAQLVQPIRMRWSPTRVHDAALIKQVEQRRPAEAQFRLASVECTTRGNWLWPDRLMVTFHAVSPRQDAALAQYLATHQLARSVAVAPEYALEATHASAPVTTYISVALMLALITGFEVAILYLPEALRPPRWAMVLVLMLLSVVKFGIVVSFFMHLRYDHRLYTGLFVGGLVMAIGTMMALLALFRAPQAARTGAMAPATVVESASDSRIDALAGSASAGRGLFQQSGCGSCHTVDAVLEARGTMGPRLDGLSARAAHRVPGMSAEEYMRQSVEAPDAYSVPGYLKLMPALRAQMSPQEFADLLTFLHTL